MTDAVVCVLVFVCVCVCVNFAGLDGCMFRVALPVLVFFLTF